MLEEKKNVQYVRRDYLKPLTNGLDSFTTDTMAPLFLLNKNKNNYVNNLIIFYLKYFKVSMPIMPSYVEHLHFLGDPHYLIKCFFHSQPALI